MTDQGCQPNPLLLSGPTDPAFHTSEPQAGKNFYSPLPAYLELISAFEAEKRGSNKADTATRIKCPFASKRKACSVLKAVHDKPMRVIEVRMEQCRNEWAGETGDPRENSLTSVIVRHNSHVRKSGITVNLALWGDPVLSAILTEELRGGSCMPDAKEPSAKISTTFTQIEAVHDDLAVVTDPPPTPSSVEVDDLGGCASIFWELGPSAHRSIWKNFFAIADDTINTAAGGGSAVFGRSHLAECGNRTRSGVVRYISEEDGRRRETARRRRMRCLWCERTRGRGTRRMKSNGHEGARKIIEHCALVLLRLDYKLQGTALAKRLARSPPTKSNRVQSPAGSFSQVGIVPHDAVGRRVFSGISVCPAASFRHHSIFTSINLIGSQDLVIKSRPISCTATSTSLLSCRREYRAERAR
ncbi:hypothetical protein PR048_017533 [Dryococelus australis]|uniref:Uncharacterized protein n=1 Tax=Dryococelus australis TaxID=614101 RepID=A0ABQ9H9V1_9NEOP|nr:hypothetical protein PR048_017533 [Dryococelus australis]